MRYKIGDKIEMNKDREGIRYTTRAIEELQEYNYIFTIEKIEDQLYIMKETGSYWPESAIKELIKIPQDPNNLINNRFEIMDL